MSRLRTGKPTSRPRRALWRPRLPLWLVPAAVAPVVFLDALLGFRLLAAEDGFIYYLPLHILAGDAIADGSIPSWNPFAFSGFPLLALTQAGVFYPPNVLFVFLPHFFANNVTLIANISIGATGTFFFARRMAKDEYGAIVAGATFASCGFVYGHLAHQSILAAAAWLPWTLLAYERARERGSAVAVGLVAASLALCLLTGHAQMFSLSAVVLAVYATSIWVLTSATPAVRRTSTVLVLAFAAVAALQIVLPEFGPVIVAGLIAFVAAIVSLIVKIGRDVWRIGAAAGLGELAPLWIVPVAVVASLALAAVQVLPNVAVLDETIRADLTYQLAMAYSFPASHLALLPFPYLFGNPWEVQPFDAAYLGRWNLTELAGYPGAAALVLATAGTVRLRQNTAAVALVVAGGVALLMALGGSTAFGVLMWATPVIGDFRSWGRAVVVVDLVVAVLAALGIARLRSGDSQLGRTALRRASLAVVALVACAAVLPLLPSVSRFVVDGWDRVVALAVPLIAAALGLLGAYLVFRRHVVATAAVVMLIVLDGLLAFGAYSDWRLAPSPDEARAEYSAARAPSWGAMPTGAEIPPSRYLYVGRKIESIVPDFTHVTSVKGIPSANGYEPLAPAAYARALGDMTAFGGVLQRRRLLSRRWLFDLLRVSVVLAPRNERVPIPEWLGEPRLVGGLRRFEYTPRLPAAFVVASTRRGDEDDALRALSSSSFDAARTAIVGAGCTTCPSGTSAAPSGTASATRWDPGKIDLDVSPQASSLVVVSESWFPGWTAKVDGEPAEVVRTDGLVIGVPVPAGARVVELRYRTPGLRVGAGVSVVAVLTLGALLLLALRRRG